MLFLDLGVGLGLVEDAGHLKLEPGHLGLHGLHLGFALGPVRLGLGEEGFQLFLAGLEHGGQGALQQEEEGRTVDGEVQELDQEGAPVAVFLAEERHGRPVGACAMAAFVGCFAFRCLGCRVAFGGLPFVPRGLGLMTGSRRLVLLDGLGGSVTLRQQRQGAEGQQEGQ